MGLASEAYRILGALRQSQWQRAAMPMLVSEADQGFLSENLTVPKSHGPEGYVGGFRQVCAALSQSSSIESHAESHRKVTFASVMSSAGGGNARFAGD
jgi:hypothetical protein